jgi:glycosyltransferase involved in cell wall biosynthesis
MELRSGACVMRILFCNYEYPPLGGGGGVINALLAQEMAKRHEVTVLTSLGWGLPAERLERGVKVVRVPVFFHRRGAVSSLRSMLGYILMGMRVGRQLVRAHQFDIVNTHFVLPTGPVGDALSRFAGIPNVLTLLGGDIYDPSKFTSPHRHPLLRSCIRGLLRRADLVVGDSSDVIEKMRRFYTPEIEGVRIPLGIDKPRVSAMPREHYGLGQDDVLLITVGRLIPRKAVIQLISLMEALKHTKARLLIVGSGPQEYSLKAESRRRQLEGQIFFIGHATDAEKFRILQMCDVYVSTSQHEGFGLVFLEAMACGLPIICYDHGGQTDFLRHQKTGYLVPLNDLPLFKQYCALLINNPRLREVMHRTNLQRFEAFCIDKCALSYESVFSEVVYYYAEGKRKGCSRSHMS